MLKIVDEAHFHRVLQQIEELDSNLRVGGVELRLLPLLEKKLHYLHHHPGTVELGFDRSPLSFSVVWRRDGSNYKNGRGFLAFHPGDGDDRSFLHEIDPPPGPHWSIHT